MPFKVFVVALHKSGTSSLHDFAVRAGLKSSHSPAVDNGVNYEKRILPHIDDHAAILNVMAPVIERYDVHGDIPWSGLYRAAQKSYPDARFVLMERDADQWWEPDHKLRYFGIVGNTLCSRPPHLGHHASLSVPTSSLIAEAGVMAPHMVRRTRRPFGNNGAGCVPDNARRRVPEGYANRQRYGRCWGRGNIASDCRNG
ncbi:MAG: hypothetical protein HKP56_08165 [Anderseniella sp.]|nr:hypothetical protein [Anderseniella sp.]